MERLTIEEVQQIKDDWNDPYMGKPNNFWENRINSLFDTIEAQEQEIDRLKHHIDNHIKWNEAHTKARVEQGELIDKLIKDKDEQAGQIIRLENERNAAVQALTNHVKWNEACKFCKADCIDAGTEGIMDQCSGFIYALLGGAKDGK